jgi:hypothetical protein
MTSHRLACLVACSLLLASAPGCDTEGTARRNKDKAAPIISALDAYKRDNGRYPNTLAALVPKYLKQIDKPAATASGDWDYEPQNDGQEFFIGFEGSGEHYNAYYLSTERQWGTDTK